MDALANGDQDLKKARTPRLEAQLRQDSIAQSAVFAGPRSSSAACQTVRQWPSRERRGRMILMTCFLGRPATRRRNEPRVDTSAAP